MAFWARLALTTPVVLVTLEVSTGEITALAPAEAIHRPREKFSMARRANISDRATDTAGREPALICGNCTRPTWAGGSSEEGVNFARLGEKTRSAGTSVDFLVAVIPVMACNRRVTMPPSERKLYTKIAQFYEILRPDEDIPPSFYVLCHEMFR